MFGIENPDNLMFFLGLGFLVLFSLAKIIYPHTKPGKKDLDMQENEREYKAWKKKRGLE